MEDFLLSSRGAGVIIFLLTSVFSVTSEHPPASDRSNLIRTLLLNQESLSHTLKDMVTSDDLNDSLIQLRNDVKHDMTSINVQHTALQNAITVEGGLEGSKPQNVSTAESNQDCPKERPVDCMSLKKEGVTTSGVYEIYPVSCCKPVKAFCDMQSDDGGWTTFLTRGPQPVPENFARSWEDYKAGFGNPYTEYWIGNEVLHKLTENVPTLLRVDAMDYNGTHKYGKWLQFSVGNLSSKYTLSVGNFQTTGSTLGNSMSYSSSRMFTTLDQDNDGSSGSNCAADRTGGGWWYHACEYCTPTAIMKNTNNRADSMGWYQWNPTGDARDVSLVWLQLKLKPFDTQGQVRMCRE